MGSVKAQEVSPFLLFSRVLAFCHSKLACRRFRFSEISKISKFRKNDEKHCVFLIKNDPKIATLSRSSGLKKVGVFLIKNCKNFSLIVSKKFLHVNKQRPENLRSHFSYEFTAGEKNI